MADVRSGMDSETRGNMEQVYVEIGPLWMYNDVAICGKNGVGWARLTPSGDYISVQSTQIRHLSLIQQSKKNILGNLAV